MYVCSCRAVTDSQVKAAVVAGACSLDDVTRSCGAGGGCGGCLELLARLLADIPDRGGRANHVEMAPFALPDP